MRKNPSLGAVTLAITIGIAAMHPGVSMAATTHSQAQHQNEKPDFATMTNVIEKKTAFFAYLAPAIKQINQRIEADRAKLHCAFKAAGPIAPSSFLNAMAKQYDVPMPAGGPDRDWQQAVLKRADIIPAPLVMSQAAIESAWGTSRFATEGNNYFGQWCYTQGCGIFPHKENGGAFHEVKRFANVEAAITAYFDNVNTNPAYQTLRDIRAQRRADNLPITADALAAGLLHYSQIGEKYVTEIRDMVRDDSKYMPQS